MKVCSMSDLATKCLACGHEASLTDGAPPSESVLVCSECGARMPFGRLAPRIVVEPFTDDEGRTWVRYRFQDPISKIDVHVADIDGQHAAMLAKATISLVIP
jgi:hypothetical protein